MPTVDQLRRRSTIRSATVTSTVDGRDHLISQQPTAAGLVIGYGQFVTICRRLIVAAPLVVPPGPTCFDCEIALHRNTTVRIRSHRRRGLLTRLLRRRPFAGSRTTTTGGSHRAMRASPRSSATGRWGVRPEPPTTG